MQPYCARFPDLKLLFIAIFLCGCASYKIPTDVFRVEEDHCPGCKNYNQALSHWLYDLIPRHRSQIRWYDMGHWTSWILFGNDDDGIFGENWTFHLDQPISGLKALKWGMRNPLHNFCFYVIGSAHRHNREITLLNLTSKGLCLFEYNPYQSRNFGDVNSSFFIALHGGKPFVSLRLAYSSTHRGNFYLGWRDRGNFGIKFAPWAEVK